MNTSNAVNPQNQSAPVAAPATPAGSKLRIDGRKIRSRRIDLGLTQVKLAEATHSTQAAISRVERGLPISDDFANLIAIALGVDTTALVSDRPERVRSRRTAPRTESGTFARVVAEQRVAVPVPVPTVRMATLAPYRLSDDPDIRDAVAELDDARYVELMWDAEQWGRELLRVVDRIRRDRRRSEGPAAMRSGG
jgi:transcriptional regulator with XRE-family HTH domain